jgi:type VI secretion system protein ImpH
VSEAPVRDARERVAFAAPTPAASASGAARVEAALRDQPTAFSFFQAVRLLSRLRPQREAVGGWADPADEIARFAATPSLGFPASEIQALALPEREDEPARMMVNLLGLTGPQGVLPHLYTEHAAARARAKDTAFRDFLDLFNHRILSLFFRAWEKHDPVVAQEAGREDRLADHLLDVSGLGTSEMRRRLPVPDEALAFYAGLLALRSRPADGLVRLVGDYFDVDATAEQFVGEWRRVDEGGQCALDEEGDAGRLGLGVIGDEAWDPQARVRLRLGPLTRAQFDDFLPGGAAHAPLCALARLYADDQVGVDAQLVLAREEVPPCMLGAVDAPSALGRGTWLSSRPFARDPDETTFRLC